MNGLLSGALAMNLVFQPNGRTAKAPFDLGETEGRLEQPARRVAPAAGSGDRRSVADAMRDLPGAYFSVGPRNERLLYFRGFEPRQLAVLYDGVPVYAPYDGYLDLGKLPASNAAEIEILGGASSPLASPGALGGTVNIVTWKPRKRFEADARLGWSEPDARSASLNLGSRFPGWYLALDGDFAEAGDFKLSRAFRGGRNEDGGTRDNSGFSRRNASAKAGITPADGHEYALGLDVTDGTWGLPPGAYDAKPKYWRFTDWRKNTYYFLGRTRVNDALSVRTRAFLDRYLNVLDAYDDASYAAQTKNSSFHSTYDDYSAGGSLRLDTAPAERHRLSALA
ncbi:MAG: TonB-dependent receptor plug domain-containing protein [Elusimicrobia bacterium]|nr:TonB-dependent receptor plug domain-containing protein [Elusimicrobiota bacterium]